MSMRNPQNDRYTVEREGRAPGSSRPKAGTAKPATKAAASVRIATSTDTSKMTPKQKMMAESTMSKEEKKAQRAKEREVENLSYTATTYLTNLDEKYKKLRRIWWGALIGAVVFTAASWFALTSTDVVGQTLSIITLVLAYVCIIGALVMDFTVIRKRRNVFRDQVAAMSRKQVERIVEESFATSGAEDAAKKARKAARKAKKSKEEQEEAAQLAREAYLQERKESKERKRAEAAALNKEERDKAAKLAREEAQRLEKAKGGEGDSADASGEGASGDGKTAKESKGGLFAKLTSRGKDKKAEEGSTTVTVVAEDGAAAAAAGTEGAAEAAPEVDEAEAARIAAAQKAARDFAASRRVR